MITYNGVTAITAKEKATLFNSYFSSVFHPPSTRSTPSYYPDPLESEAQMTEITLDVDEVSQCLSCLDTSKVTGPDGIPSRLLQACSLEIAPSICELSNHYGFPYIPPEVCPIKRKTRLPNHHPFQQVSCNNDIFKFPIFPFLSNCLRIFTILKVLH